MIKESNITVKHHRFHNDHLFIRSEEDENFVFFLSQVNKDLNKNSLDIDVSIFTMMQGDTFKICYSQKNARRFWSRIVLF